MAQILGGYVLIVIGVFLDLLRHVPIAVQIWRNSPPDKKEPAAARILHRRKSEDRTSSPETKLANFADLTDPVFASGKSMAHRSRLACVILCLLRGILVSCVDCG